MLVRNAIEAVITALLHDTNVARSEARRALCAALGIEYTHIGARIAICATLRAASQGDLLSAIADDDDMIGRAIHVVRLITQRESWHYRPDESLIALLWCNDGHTPDANEVLCHRFARAVSLGDDVKYREARDSWRAIFPTPPPPPFIDDSAPIGWGSIDTSVE